MRERSRTGRVIAKHPRAKALRRARREHVDEHSDDQREDLERKERRCTEY